MSADAEPHETHDIHPDLVKGNSEEEVEAAKPNLLPPIHTIEVPTFTTKSGLIRWLRALGYEVKVIAQHLGIKYQMVRNITTTEPKRAAREDLAPLEIVLKATPDIIEAALDGALDASLMEGRRERNKKRLDSLRENPDATDD